MRAVGDDLGYLGSETFSYDFERCFTALIFCSIMQEAADRLNLAATGGQHATGYAQQVRDVWDAASLSGLVAMKFGRIHQRIVKGSGKCHPDWSLSGKEPRLANIPTNLRDTSKPPRTVSDGNAP
jgi:hypothetical protein